MYATSQHVFLRCTLVLATLLAFNGAVSAQSLSLNTTGLGQAQPQTADLSISPNFHVYQFQLNGIRYIQINDLQNVVRAAFAVANGQVLPLPIGVDSQGIFVEVQSGQGTSAGLWATVYQDAQVQVVAVPLSGGYGWEVLIPAQISSSATSLPALPNMAGCTPRGCSGVDVISVQVSQ